MKSRIRRQRLRDWFERWSPAIVSICLIILALSVIFSACVPAQYNIYVPAQASDSHYSTLPYFPAPQYRGL